MKSRDLLVNTKICLFVVDPENTSRSLEIRGEWS
jgi:hypothetical protein